MNEKNLIRAITRDGSAYVLVCDSTKIVNRASEIHHTSKTMTAALGRALTAASLMGSMLKGKDNSLTLQFKCDGPAGDIVCVSDWRGNVRGYAANPAAELPPNDKGKLDVGGVVGTGMLYVTKDLGLNEPYVGMCPIESGEIAEDITGYYVRSEQIPTACALGVLVNQDLTCRAAGGFMVQLLPGADDSVISRIEENIAGISSVSQMVENGMTPHDIAATVFEGIAFDRLDEARVEYQCNCSREKYEKILYSLGKKELESLMDEDEPVETVCNFCNAKYVFSLKELEDMIKKLC